MSEPMKSVCIDLLCLIVGVYVGYSMAYHDVMTGCDNTGHLSDKHKIYTCEDITKVPAKVGGGGE